MWNEVSCKFINLSSAANKEAAILMGHIPQGEYRSLSQSPSDLSTDFK